MSHPGYISVSDLIEKLKGFPPDADADFTDLNQGYILDFEDLRLRHRKDQPPLVQFVLNSERDMNTKRG